MQFKKQWLWVIGTDDAKRLSANTAKLLCGDARMNVPITKDFMQNLDSVVGFVSINENLINPKELASKMEKGLVEIVPAFIYKDGKAEFTEFSLVVMVKT